MRAFEVFYAILFCGAIALAGDLAGDSVGDWLVFFGASDWLRHSERAFHVLDGSCFRPL